MSGDDEIRLYDGPAPGSEGWTHSARRYWSELWDTGVVARVRCGRPAGGMGFSAGGNVAVRVAYADDPDVRPDWIAPIYATTRGLQLGEPPAGNGPMFLTVATDDELGLTDDSIALYEQWRRAELPVELHAYAQGGHGFGMRTNHVPADTWVDRFLDWCWATIRR